MTIATPIHVTTHEWSEIAAVVVILALTVLPVSLAARFADARRPGFLWSALAVVIAGIAVQFVLHAMGATLAGLAVAFLAMCAVYALVLETSLIGAVGVAVMAFFLQVVIAVGLVSFGLHVQGYPH
ncbi:MAG TPA: hypothetical protein VGH80_13210 [Xanthomonadaceae bacterium]|jgi:hypothetical protein